MKIADLFGTGVTLNTSNAADPVLQIPLSAIAAASGFDTPPTSGDDSAEKWFTGIFLQADAHLKTITDDSNNITIDYSFKSNATRNSQEMVGFNYNATFYQEDANGTKPDPDLV